MRFPSFVLSSALVVRAPIALCASLAICSSAALAAPAPAPATGDPADPAAWLRRYDQIMAPPAFEVDAEMTAHREDGTARAYKMRVLKAGTDKLRARFTEPASARGQEMLRSGDNLWLYMPNLKRAVRVASRDQFMGGDFNNADVLRVHYEADYSATLGKSDKPGTLLLELKAKSPQVAYDAIKLWMTSDKGPASAQPVRAEFYAASGKLLRSAEFKDVRDVGAGWLRPASIVMRNELQPARYSEMHWGNATLKDDIPAQRFVVDDLGR